MILNLMEYLISVIFLLSLNQTSAFHVDEEFKYVTLGSLIKLTHKSTSYKLHSHNVMYSTGSQQQRVRDCNKLKSQKIKCGQNIRLKHSETKKYLHSHYHTSVLSNNQEISAYEGSDSGDNWTLECSKTFWERENDVRLKHADTKMYLTTSSSYSFTQGPIPGQLEVHGYAIKNNNNIWIAQEGYYFQQE
ncbi:MIR motif domain-containing protein [Rozella allomycis CSF55]|uniref:MIR motif domain-containing protein n=1 Tax=Rozella allomycis (strain CSF55) TaxID=988480 RepID=A0A075AVQ4_ROZAC|nr:MIR motif domain-containing protein [Rozella allomycis CSF55]|eukprot:EPZ34408.1 MIR motif domain-containing protein [Rozella allomycis CSF55]